MNQEILSNGIATNGKTLPNTITLNEISAVPWSNLGLIINVDLHLYQ
jgi:hypothetical protein